MYADILVVDVTEETHNIAQVLFYAFEDRLEAILNKNKVAWERKREREADSYWMVCCWKSLNKKDCFFIYFSFFNLKNAYNKSTYVFHLFV